MINIQELQNLTQNAIHRGILEKKRKDEEDLRQKIALKEKQKADAANILAQIPSRALTEASAGRNFAIVMSIGYLDFDTSKHHPTNTMKPEWITGEVAKMVYSGCVDMKLNPTIEFWHDGCGIKSGYNIVVHW